MAESVGLGAPITPATAIDPRIHPNSAVTPAQARGEQDAQRQAPPDAPTQLALGTIVKAIVRTPSATGPAAGTQLLLRIVAPDPSATDLVSGTVVEVTGNETLAETPLGLLAVQRRLALVSGTPIAFVVIELLARGSDTPSAPARSGGWLALEETLFALLDPAPALAELIRAVLTPRSGAQLAGTLLFLTGALYHGSWPGAAVSSALQQSGQGKLAQRLAADITALRRLSDDASTGDWRVLTLPLLSGNVPLAVRLYLQRRKPGPEEALHFALEIELSRLGPVQLDGLLRDNRLILVARSHRELEPELRQELKEAFAQALAGTGFSGDLSFATAANFLVRPLDQLREHIKITA